MTSKQKLECARCGKRKAKSEFYGDPRKKNGYHSWCKPCVRAGAAEYREANRERINTYMRAYSTRPEVRERNRKNWTRYHRTEKGKRRAANHAAASKQRNPQKFKARWALALAVRNGLIVRPNKCQTCGNPGKVEAHHHLGYAPQHIFDVHWLCFKCHRAAHN